MIENYDYYILDQIRILSDSENNRPSSLEDQITILDVDVDLEPKRANNLGTHFRSLLRNALAPINAKRDQIAKKKSELKKAKEKSARKESVLNRLIERRDSTRDIRNFLPLSWACRNFSEIKALLPSESTTSSDYIIESVINYAESVKNWDAEVHYFNIIFSEMKKKKKRSKITGVAIPGESPANWRLGIYSKNRNDQSEYIYFIPSTACSRMTKFRRMDSFELDTNDPYKLLSRLSEPSGGEYHNFDNAPEWITLAALGAYGSEKDIYRIPKRFV